MKKILTLLYIAFFLNFTIQSSIADVVNNNIPEHEKNYIDRHFYSSDLNNQELFDYIESTVYQSVIENLDDDYYIEEISTIYISKEYLETLSYNSQENIYFGYKLSELDAHFQGQKYIFTLGDNGQTIVRPFEKYDDTIEKIVKNVAIGTGVILVCVTVAAVSGGVGLPAVSMIFAASAKSAFIFALNGAASGAIISGAIEGVKTRDFDKAMKAAALGASEGFKWGAISGAVSGGLREGIALKNAATQSGYNMNEVARIQKDYSSLKKFNFREGSYDNLKLGREGNGQILGENFKEFYGKSIPQGSEAHHIVPSNKAGAAANKCREIFKKFNIDINDPHNCAPLPKSREIAKLTKTMQHSGPIKTLHGEEIMQELSEQLSRATSRSDVFEILADFRKAMLTNIPIW